MSPEAQRIALAEARGWMLCQARPSMINDKPWISGMNPSPDVIETIIPCDGSSPRKPNESDYGYETLPDYPIDLNAIHEVEQMLSREQRELYIIWLSSITQNRPFKSYHKNHSDTPWMVWFVATATAAQRLEALVKTLNLWV